MSETLPSLPWQHVSEGVVPASVDRVFVHLDDHARLVSHMERSSWMLGGGTMQVELGAARGRAVGSRIAMFGRAFGFRLALEEVVTVPGAAKLRVVIDYALPDTGAGRVLGRLFGPAYARWCTRRMVDDAIEYFSAPTRGRQANGQ